MEADREATEMGMRPLIYARGKPRRYELGTMNGGERRYASRLEVSKLAGQIFDYKYEAIKFRLADNTFYTPDFMVMLSDGTLEFHEYK